MNLFSFGGFTKNPVNRTPHTKPMGILPVVLFKKHLLFFKVIWMKYRINLRTVALYTGTSKYSSSPSMTRPGLVGC